MSHANAFLTPADRLHLARLVVDEGWSHARAAERFQCSTATVKKWADLLRAGEPMTDRSSRPNRSPCRPAGTGSAADGSITPSGRSFISSCAPG